MYYTGFALGLLFFIGCCFYTTINKSVCSVGNQSVSRSKILMVLNTEWCELLKTPRWELCAPSQSRSMQFPVSIDDDWYFGKVYSNYWICIDRDHGQPFNLCISVYSLPKSDRVSTVYIVDPGLLDTILKHPSRSNNMINKLIIYTVTTGLPTRYSMNSIYIKVVFSFFLQISLLGIINLVTVSPAFNCGIWVFETALLIYHFQYARSTLGYQLLFSFMVTTSAKRQTAFSVLFRSFFRFWSNL